MREFFGISSDISHPILGVISTKPFAYRVGKNLIFVIKDQNKFRKIFPFGFIHRNLLATIISDKVPLSTYEGVPCLSNVAEEICNTLNDGDVVLIEPTGKAAILYLASSSHNALFVTNRCNCLCIMCPQPPTADKDSLFEYNFNLISLLGKIKPQHLGITGGEPTLLGNDLIKLIAKCREKIPNTSLTLLTNGRKLQDMEFAKALVQAGKCNLVVEIPLYSDNENENDFIMGVKGSFYETLKGFHNLALLEQPVGIRMVLHALTIGRLNQYSEFIYRNLPFVINVAFMGMETTGFAKKNLDFLWIDPYEYRYKLESAVKYLIQRNVPVSIYNHQLCTLPKSLWAFAKRSISTWKEKYLPLCNECSEKDNCCGIFGTGEKYSEYLRPI